MDLHAENRAFPLGAVPDPAVAEAAHLKLVTHQEDHREIVGLGPQLADVLEVMGLHLRDFVDDDQGVLR